MEERKQEIKENSEEASELYREIRKSFRTISMSTLLLLLVLIGAMAIKLIKSPIAYSLFCIIFVIDFGRHAALIWKERVYWWGGKRFFKGTPARIVAALYGTLSVIMLAFAIFFLLR